MPILDIGTGFTGNLPLFVKLMVYQAVCDFFTIKTKFDNVQTVNELKNILEATKHVGSAYRFLFVDTEKEFDFGNICRKLRIDPDERRQDLLRTKYLGGDEVRIFLGHNHGVPGGTYLPDNRKEEEIWPDL